MPSRRVSQAVLLFAGISFVFARGEVVQISERRNAPALHRGDTLNFKEGATYKINDHRKKLLLLNKKFGGDDGASASTNKLKGVLFLSSECKRFSCFRKPKFSKAFDSYFNMTLLNHSKGFRTWSENGLCV